MIKLDEKFKERIFELQADVVHLVGCMVTAKNTLQNLVELAKEFSPDFDTAVSQAQYQINELNKEIDWFYNINNLPFEG